MNVIDLLKSDHETVDGLFKSFESAKKSESEGEKHRIVALHLARVRRADLPGLDLASWEFFCGCREGGDRPVWRPGKPGLEACYPILSRPFAFGHTGMSYLAPLQRYLLVGWRYPLLDRETWNVRTSVWDFYESETPWGPAARWQQALGERRLLQPRHPGQVRERRRPPAVGAHRRQLRHLERAAGEDALHAVPRPDHPDRRLSATRAVTGSRRRTPVATPRLSAGP